MADAFADFPPALAAILDSLEFEEDGWVTFQAFRMEGDGCVLDLGVRTGVEDDPPQRWRFAFASCLEHRLAGRRGSGAQGFPGLHSPPHVLLEPWAEPSAHLWFSGTVAEPARVAEALHRRHAELSSGFAGVPLYLNGGYALAELLALRVGQLARGPAPLLRAYAEVLRAHGVEPTLREYTSGLADADASALRALTWGDSYVIGAGFHAEQIA